jgi:hypothetical protein
MNREPRSPPPNDRAPGQGDGERTDLEDAEVEQRSGDPVLPEGEQEERDDREGEQPEHGGVEAVVGEEPDGQDQRADEHDREHAAGVVHLPVGLTGVAW